MGYANHLKARHPSVVDSVGEGEPIPRDNDVSHPSHYNFGSFEVIDVIEDWELDFHLANAIKYIARAKHKGNFVKDLKKAVWYVQRRIKKAEETK